LPLTSGLRTQRTGQPRLAGAGGTCGQCILLAFDPTAGEQVCDQTAIEATGVVIVDRFRTGAVFELGALEKALQPLRIAMTLFCVDKVRQALFKTQAAVGSLQLLMFQCFKHAV